MFFWEIRVLPFIWMSLGYIPRPEHWQWQGSVPIILQPISNEPGHARDVKENVSCVTGQRGYILALLCGPPALISVNRDQGL